MQDLRRTFLAGRMNLDADERTIGKGEYRLAQNIQVAHSEGSDVGAIEKVLSNTVKTSLNIGTTVNTISGLEDTSEDKIYWLANSDTGNYVLEYDVRSETATKVAEDTRVGDENALGFDTNFYAQMVLIIDSDTNNRYLAFTDGNTQPKLLNIERAKTWGANGFTLSDILLIKAPPLSPPTITLNSNATKEETLKETFINIAYRYKYLDNQFSALSPFTNVAFKPETFKYNFSSSSNEGMVNSANEVLIEFNTGGPDVLGVELVFKVGNTDLAYVIDYFDKEKLGYANNAIENFVFNNTKTYQVLPERQLFRLFDNVPLSAKAIAVINNSIVLGNYVENYDLVESNGSKISSTISLSPVETDIASGTPTESLKVNRDYEIARVYIDDYGRMTTPITDLNNTISFSIEKCVKKNQIQATVNGKAPAFAKYMRFFIKENKKAYETIAPTLFFTEGNYIYFYIQPADVNKLNTNDNLIVKADTEGIKNKVIKLKVLDLERKEKDWITTNNGGQPEGFYIKTSILNEDVRFDENSYNFYEYKDYDESENSDRISGEGTDFTKTLFKGDTLDDLTPTASFSTSVDLRYEIEIVSTGPTDTFRWRVQQTDGTWNDNGGSGISITGVSQTLDADLDITFGAITGHSSNDKWLVKVNKGFSPDEDNRAYAFFVTEENITIGSLITLKYYSKKEKSPVSDNFLLNLVSNDNYENIEEWYYGDEIYNQILAAPDFSQTLDRFWFRPVLNEHDVDSSGLKHAMIIESQEDSRNSTRKVYSDVYIEIRTLEQLPIFEKELVDANDNLEVYHEIGRTYSIDNNGFHISGFDGDTDQTDIQDGVFVLDVFNCFAWGNGFESYKLRDQFNARSFSLNSRSLVAIDDYRQNKRIASFTYSGVYEQTTNFNALNEFNLSQANFKNLDDANGPIYRLVSWNNDIDVFQEDKVTKVFYDKELLYNLDGSSNLRGSNQLFQGTKTYSGEYGISKDDQSLTVFGNYVYWVDTKRGMALRKGQSGIEVISNFGMRDYFRDKLLSNNAKIIGCYDGYTGQYIVNIGSDTLAFDEKVKGWSSFYSYIPDMMIGVNNRFFTIKNGQVWQHHVGSNHANFYGTQYDTKVTVVINDEPSIDKIFKTVTLESQNAWSVVLKTNLTNGKILLNEFRKRESRWYASIKRNESQKDLRGKAHGIGIIQNATGTSVNFLSVNEKVSIGDELIQMNGSNQEIIGTITDKNEDTIIVDAINATPIFGAFSFAKKNSRVSGSSIRGYYIEIELTDSTDTANEIFAVRSGAVKSYL
jgi:hypothetical protein